MTPDDPPEDAVLQAVRRLYDGAAAHYDRDKPAVDLTLLDASPAMLAHSGDVEARRVVGDVTELPFPDDAFNVVVSAWVIETLAVPARAVKEYLRVLAPGGLVVYTFCSLPDRWWTRAATSRLRALVKRSYAGDFLPAERIPWHDCDRSHLVRFRGGLTSEVALGKCCSVDEALLPTGSDRRPSTA
jgi:SAM-dependent methyltransferase